MRGAPFREGALHTGFHRYVLREGRRAAHNGAALPFCGGNESEIDSSGALGCKQRRRGLARNRSGALISGLDSL